MNSGDDDTQGSRASQQVTSTSDGAASLAEAALASASDCMQETEALDLKNEGRILTDTQRQGQIAAPSHSGAVNNQEAWKSRRSSDGLAKEHRQNTTDKHLQVGTS